MFSIKCYLNLITLAKHAFRRNKETVWRSEPMKPLPSQTSSLITKYLFILGNEKHKLYVSNYRFKYQQIQ